MLSLGIVLTTRITEGQMYHARKKIQLHVSMEDIQSVWNWGCRGDYMATTVVEGTLFNLFQAIYLFLG